MSKNRFLLALACLVPSIIVIHGQQSCSVYNPCGRNGYCEDDAHGRWQCICKFWWSGTLCNKCNEIKIHVLKSFHTLVVVTNNGVQVIILGSLLAILIIMYYGLIIFNWLSKKKHKPEQQKKYSQSAVHINTTSRSLIRSYLIVLSTLVVALLGLVVKWSILQPIHNEIVEKFHQNRSLFYDSHRLCHVLDYNKFNMILFPISCLLIVIFALEHRRVSCMINLWHGHFASPVPLDFFTHSDRKFVAVTFAICANELLEIINQTLNGSTPPEHGIILIYLQRILQVLAMGFRYYPILVAVNRNSSFSLTLGTLYIWLEFPVTIIQQGLCQSKYYSTMENMNRSSTELLLRYYGTGSFLVIIELVTDIPGYFCFAYISVKLPILLFDKICRRRIQVPYSKILTREEQALIKVTQTNSVEMVYVRNLSLTHKHRSNQNNIFARFIPKMIYEWRDDFRFSSRVLCIYSSIFLLLYFTLIQTCVQLLPYMDLFQRGLQEIIDLWFGNRAKSSFSVPHFIRPFMLAVVIATIVIIGQLSVLLTGIRRNLLQAFRGDDCEIPRVQRLSYVNSAIGNFHFAGYLIGYVVWGWILMLFFTFISFMCIDLLITLNVFHIFEWILKTLIPILLLYYFKEFLNKILARFIFLQHNGDALAVNNRRVLMIFLYFNFFLDAFLGLVSSILRLLQSFIGAIIYMSRLDYSPLGRKLETWDDGFSAYCGFIHIECAHRHPVLLVFVGHLLSIVKSKEDSVSRKTVMTDAEHVITGDERAENTRAEHRRRQWIRKWQLAAFLVRNPSILFLRKAYINQFHSNSLVEVSRAINYNIQQIGIRRYMSV
ncbi:unnamed protein product [Rotaria magnacalcarata]